MFLIMLSYFAAWGLYSRYAKKRAKSKAMAAPQNPNGALHVLDGVTDVLEVFENKISITAKNTGLGLLARGRKGTKTIPIASISAIQFFEAKTTNGYIQFTLPGGVESGGGILAATTDENSVFFSKLNNERARAIRDYLDQRIIEIKSPQLARPSSVADELEKLAQLKERGVLSEAEFMAAKSKLMGGVAVIFAMSITLTTGVFIG